ncbi:MAG: transcription-repair coupling factor [Lachnospiraceae bacterium]
MANLLEDSISELAEYEALKSALEKGAGPLQVSGCMDSQRVHLMSQIGKEKKWQLVLTYNEIRARELYEDFRFFTDNVWLYASRDLIFFCADVQSIQLERQRMQALKPVLLNQGGVFITTIDALMSYLPPLAALKDCVKVLMVGDILELGSCQKELSYMGYEKTGIVSEPGQFAVHGGILDIFPLTEEAPLRIELWDDTIDSIRSFDRESQRSIENLEVVEILPASEVVMDVRQLLNAKKEIAEETKYQYEKFKQDGKLECARQVKREGEDLQDMLDSGMYQQRMANLIHYFYPVCSSLLDYFPEDSYIWMDEPIRLKERASAVELEFRESMTSRLEKGYILPRQVDLIYSVDWTMGRLQRKYAVAFNSLEQKLPFFKINETYRFHVQNVPSYQNNFDLLIQDLTTWKKNQYRVLLLCGSRSRAERLAKNLQEYDFRSYASFDWNHGILPGEIMLTSGNLHRGFVYPMIRFVVITEGDIFGKEKKKEKRKFTSQYQGQKLSSFAELSVGDYVVHENYGMGIYRGIEKIERDNVTKDYLKVEYGDGGILYILATQFYLLQKYGSANADRKPKLNRLGGNEWSKTKSKVSKAVREVAKELVTLYAARQNGRGFAYTEDTVWQKEFEEMFPFEETQDQLTAIEDTKKDMESSKIMDRLICGDVGYGKTEIALRAAFKAVQDSKQVVYLVPTTILAQQHYNTFQQRMKDFPVRVELLCRFRTPAQIKKTLNDLKKGLVDIVIGTHRVLSKDVVFKDLGLLIVDEEQRFGVTHKEKIKQMRNNVDALTLTATPIPRTLHMSLIGIREMSVLEEAPMDRLPVQTYVMEYNAEMVREAINRELARNGQVYYVYNRIQDIEERAAEIAKLVPDANVEYAHGQMPQRQLENIMMEFINGEIDVLVSTTIIETGLDIPNVNTIIIHDADRFGLSQLYQLRGRVGRSNRMAYAFILYKKDKVLKEVAEKRLAAIREFTELGSGIKIAMRDLEIRGVGTLLGEAQHGHMEAVGYDLYCKMLNEAVQSFKGDTPPIEEQFETTIDMHMDAWIPSTYIKNEALKLDMYKRIAAIETEQDREDMEDELIDRFGDYPKSVANLLLAAELRALAHEAYVTEVKGNVQEMRITLFQEASFDSAGFVKLIEEYQGTLKFYQKETNYLIWTNPNKAAKDLKSSIEIIKLLLKKIKLLIVS